MCLISLYMVSILADVGLLKGDTMCCQQFFQQQKPRCATKRLAHVDVCSAVVDVPCVMSK